jgi:hypothetical protein
MRLEASDVTGQKILDIPDAPMNSSIREFVEGLVPQMNLPRFDSSGRRLNYHALLDREGRHLHASEVVGEALLPNDRLVLQPDINAGGAPERR